MSLHTEFRPKKWEEVVGHSKIVKSIKTAVEDKLSHTFLLTGPSGVGKTTLARVLANSLGCKKQNLMEVDAATFTGIDDMRAVMDTLQYRPITGDVKVIVIDECHALSSQAKTAVLKAIEEPPSWAYLVFCTTEVGKVPAAIKTRCTTYNLKPVDVEDIVELLKEIAKKSKLTPAEGVIELCAKEALGSPRQAITNLEVCADAKNRKVAAELLESAGQDSQAIDLARLLMKGAPWKAVQKTLRDMKGVNPESVRHVVRSYMTTVILGAPHEGTVGRCMEVLDAFSTPFYSGDGVSPLVLACGKLLLGR